MISTSNVNHKHLNFAAIKQNKSENKIFDNKFKPVEEPIDTTTVATSKMNSEDDLSQSLNEIELVGFDQTEKIDDPELLKLQNYEVSSMSSDDFILTASMMDEDDCL